MKVKTSITLPKDLIAQIDELAEGAGNRSAFIEAAVATYIETLRRSKRDRDDLCILNVHSEKLNREMREFLKCQVETWE